MKRLFFAAMRTATFMSAFLLLFAFTPKVSYFERVLNTFKHNFNQQFAKTNSKSSSTQKSLALSFSPGATCIGLASNAIGGNVWEDLNYDGDNSNEPNIIGLSGITVELYNAKNVKTNTATTDQDGNYLFSNLTEANYRIEFILPDHLKTALYSTKAGTSNGTTVQFVTPGSCANLGLSNPSNYCDTDPYLITPCYISGEPLGMGTSENGEVLVSYPNKAGAAKSDVKVLARNRDIGSTWGVAYARNTKQIFAGAVLKRHTGFGPLGIDGIYKIDNTDPNNPVIDNWLNLQNIGVDVGANPRTYQLPVDVDQSSVDPAAFDAIGKIGIGDVDISGDEKTLYALNLNNNGSIAFIDIANKSLIKEVAIPNPGCGTDGEVRPWALAVYRGTLYVGLVCSGETSGSGDLKFFVLKYDGTSFSTLFTESLNYSKGFVHATYNKPNNPEICSNWETWISDYSGMHQAGITSTGPRWCRPQAILSDMEFDRDGSIILAFMDRTGHQTGYAQSDLDTTLGHGYVGGDLLRVHNNNGTYQLENAGTTADGGGCGLSSVTGTSYDTLPQGPGGGEYYCGEKFSQTHQETTLGGIALSPSDNAIAANVMDPKTLFSGGTAWLNNSTGASDRTFELYISNPVVGPASPGTFGKAAGLGDLELACAPAPLEIGNYVWNDKNANGIQDATEMGIDGITVELLKNNQVIASTTTQNGGQYYFSEDGATNQTWSTTGDKLLPNMEYCLRIALSETALKQGVPTGADKDSSTNGDARDSDAKLDGAYAKITLTTGNPGFVNHDYDFGFVSGNCIGDYVWKDVNENGLQDSNEEGIDGIKVELLKNNQVIATSTTSGGGLYTFTEDGEPNQTWVTTGNKVEPNMDYVVRINHKEELGKYKFTLANQPDDEKDNDAIINGDYAEIAVRTGNIGTINHNNDFGFIPRLCVGNLVWLDTNNNGLVDNGEAGVPNVEVILYNLGPDNTKNTSDDVEIAKQTTDKDGLYRFDTLKAGTYYIKLNSGIPADHRSSTGAGTDGQGTSSYEPVTSYTDQNNNDNGSQMGTMIMSTAFELDYCKEPINDGDQDNNTDLTIDFGLTPYLSLGNLVWYDKNNDGRYNNNEQGVSNIEMILYQPGPDGQKGTSDDIEIKRTHTDTKGNYLFSFLYAGDYYVKLAKLPAGYGSSTGEGPETVDGVGKYEPAPSPNNNTNHDDNGNQMNTMIMSDLVSLDYGTEPVNDEDTNTMTNLSVDFGLYRLLRLGNLVWEDLDNNGFVSTGEPGIPNVEVLLFQVGPDGQKATGDDVLIAKDITDANGYYLFTELVPGEYYVKLNSGIDAYTSSTGEGLTKVSNNGAYESAPDPDNDMDNEDNGTQMNTMVMSELIMLEFMQEPTSEDNFVNSNLTLDFGLIKKLCLGNLVWHDQNNNGLHEANEPGFPSIEVLLFDVGPDAKKGTADDIELSKTLTNGRGFYQFCDLKPQNYYVKLNNLPSSYISSNGLGLSQINAAGPYEPGKPTNTDINSDDNGVQMGNMVMSDPTTLVLYSEPTNDDDSNSATNTTVDFGLVKKHEIMIHNPCSCLNNASSPTAKDGQFTERVTILSTQAGETWSVMAQTGAYDAGSKAIALGTVATAGGFENGMFTYYLDVRHYDGKGYSIKFSNGTDNLSTNNLCLYEKHCHTVVEDCTDCTPTPVPDTCKMTFIMGSDGEHRVDTLNCCDNKSRFLDDGFFDGLYKDSTARNDRFTICPQNQWQTLNFVFSEFGLETGDTLYVYDGRLTTDSLLGKYSGAGVSQTGGWVASSCSPAKNPSGCLTFQLVTDGDNNKDIGWNGNFECSERDIQLTPPNIPAATLKCAQVSHPVTITQASVKAACGTVQDSQIIRIYNQHGTLCKDTCLAFKEDFQEVFAFGSYRIVYKLKSDTVKTAETTISVQAPAHTCNDLVRMPLGSGCDLVVTPDDLLEGPCDTIADTLYYYITIKGKDKNGKEEIIVSGGGKGGNYPILTKEQFVKYGGQLTAEIERRYYEGLNLTICNNGVKSVKCSTTIEVSDNNGPTFTSFTRDTFKVCDIVLTEAGLGLSKPKAVDNCNEVEVKFAGAVITKDGGVCDTTDIDVTWSAEDSLGNKTTQVQKVVLIRADLNDIVKAADKILSCGTDTEADFQNTAKVGVPGIKIGRVKNGVLQPRDTIPLSTEKYICGYILQKRDVQINADCGKKLYRYWDVLDWCQSNEGPIRLDTQFIELKDTIAPVFDLNSIPFTNLALDHYACTYDITKLPKPTATDNCSAVSVRLDSVFRIEDGKLWAIEANKLKELDCDSFQIRWVAEDACHEQLKNDTLIQQVLIKDVTKPSMVCTDKINVSISKESIKMYATDFDAGSSDACGIEKLEVSRDGIAWSDSIYFTCEDVHQTIKVHLRATDKKGNQNTCWASVIVEDKIAPVCTPLPDQTGYCDAQHADEFGPSTDTNGDSKMSADEWQALPSELVNYYNENYGHPLCSDNITCADLTIEQQYQLIPWPCGMLEIKRRYRAIDWQGEGNKSNWVEQNIKIDYKANWTIKLPADWSGTCGDDIPNSTVEITNGSCDLLAYEVTEQKFNTIEDACLKVIRTFTIINWCKYDATVAPIRLSRPANEHGEVKEGFTISSEGYEDAGRLVYTQVLKLKDKEAPIISIESPDPCINGVDGDAAPHGVEDITPGASPYECDELKTWVATAEDCSGSENITWKSRLYENGQLVKEGTESSISYVVQNKKEYKAEFWAYDGCGNSSGATTDSLKFWDCKKPSPYCLHGVAVELMQTGIVAVWASDINRASYDNCTNADRLVYKIWHQSLGLTPTNLETVKALPEVVNFTCGYLGIQTVRLYVIDEEDNWDFCETYVNVQDNMGACKDLVAQNGLANVNGIIRDWKGNTVESVEVRPMTLANKHDMMMTEQDGAYYFDLEKQQDYLIHPHKDVEPLNGVSTFDLVLISKHILKTKPFDNPYQHIAADVNQSGSITAFDLVQIRRLILNIDQEFTHNMSWKFVVADYEFKSDNPSAEDYPTLYRIEKLASDMKIDFTAIKIGDVNGNAAANGLMQSQSRTNNGVFEIVAEDQRLEAGKTYQINFSSKQLANIQGYQFTLNTGNLEFQNLQEGLSTSSNFGLHLTKNALITTSWNQHLDATNQIATDQLFTLVFKATRDGILSEELSLVNQPTSIEAINQAEELLNVQLKFNNPIEAEKDFELYQNEPNPFKETTNIGFYLPENGTVTLTFRDEIGRLLKEIKEERSKGLQSIIIDKGDLPKGLIYYQIQTKFGSKTKKMLHLK
jgi:hypothetical protein